MAMAVSRFRSSMEAVTPGPTERTQLFPGGGDSNRGSLTSLYTLRRCLLTLGCLLASLCQQAPEGTKSTPTP